MTSVEFDPFAGPAIAAAVATTEAQRELWTAARLGDDASCAFNESVTLRLRGPLEAAALRTAVEGVLHRHESLRATFSADGLSMLVAPPGPFALAELDLSAAAPAEQACAVDELKRREVEAPFDLGRGPLARFTLVRLASGEHLLVFTAHHLVCDGFSAGVLIRELAALYSAHAAGREAALAPAETFTAYAREAEERQRTPDHAADERYWVERFAVVPPDLELPADRPRPAVKTYAADRLDHALPRDLVSGLRATAKAHRASFFNVLLAGFEAILSRLTGQTDLVVAIPVAGQVATGRTALVGHCVNALPVRVSVDPAASFAALVAATRSAMVDAQDHQQFTLGSLLRKLPLHRDPSRLPLAAVCFNLDQGLAPSALRFGALEVSFASNPRRFENFDLFVNAVEQDGAVTLECQYNRDLFDAETVRRWLEGYEALLRGAADDASAAVGRLPVVTEEDQRSLARWNASEAVYPSHARIEELVEATARRVPEHVAVRCGDRAVTYRELAQGAAAVTARLRAAGVGAGDLIGLLAERDERLLTGLLGILGAGAGYVPLDPGFPTERLTFMAQDAKLRALVTTSEVAARVAVAPGVQRVLLDGATEAPGERPARAGTSDDVAYVIYTSGSTGRPKGVRVTHRSAVNLLTSLAQEPGMAERDVVLAVTTLSFDIAVLELLLPLTLGAEVLLASRDEAMDAARLRTTLEGGRATVMQATPATWRMLLAAGWNGSTGFTALCGGEPLSPELAGALLARSGALWNLYGPTETTVWSSVQRVTDATGRIPIGHPIANTQLHVLDGALQPVPVGVTGELFIGGDGVAAGYLDRPELTRERFLPDPFRPGGTLYRTGDLARRRNDGALECLGRTDFQVKVRGFRIELGEIETALAQQPAVAQAVVVAREDRPGDVRLVAYVVAREGATVDGAALRAAVQRQLPEYMVPQHVVALARLPLTGSGKVDRKALPAPTRGPAADRGVEPATAAERRVAAAFGEALALPRVALDDDFFALGGHSLLVAQMAARLGRELGVNVPMRTVFENPTPRRLAAWVDRQGDGAAGAAPPRIPARGASGPAPLSAMQQRLWYLEQLQPGGVANHVPSAHRLVGALDEAAFARAVNDVVRRQPSLRTVLGMEGDAPVQRVLAPFDVPLFPPVDLSNLAQEERARRLAAALEDEIATPFDLERGPLFRARLFRLAPDEHVFFFMPHHLVWDGWSFDLLYEELADLYGAHRECRAPRRPEPAVTYADFSAWHHGWLSGPELERQLAYWTSKLAGAPAALALPTDRPRPPRPSGDGATEWVKIPADAAERLRALTQREGATPFMALLAAWALLLHRTTGQRDLVIGTPVRGRNLPELETVMGFFVNALPLRLAVDPEASFADLLRSVRGEVMAALEHQDVPFEHLVRVLGGERDESRSPVYQTFFSFQDARQRPRAWGNLRHERVPVSQPATPQDVSMWFVDTWAGLVGGLHYNVDLLDRETAERLRVRYLGIVQEILAGPDRPIRELAATPGAERAELARWNDTRVETPAERTVAAYLAAALRREPERIAVRFGERVVTRGELDARADRLAGALAARGVGRGDVVALLLERSPDMIAALLAVLRSGATYLPLDPAFPPERLAYMLGDSGARLTLADRAADGAGLDRARVLRADGELGELGEAAPAEASGEDAAYVIYTSGSTGRPKGVRVPNRAVVNFLASMRRSPGLGESDRLLAVTTLSFDIAVLELLLPLAVGAEIVLATREEAIDGHALRALAERRRVTVMQATPATWRLLLEAGWSGGSGFTALCGGEALPPDLAEALLPRTSALWNLYGPTETTVWSTCGRVAPGQGAIDVGRPIDNTQVWVLDEAGAPAPIGVPGEIYIGGDGVALGYHERPELTAERFVPDPFAGRPGARLYRTGDLGRWRSDGKLEHLGRTDFQVKIRGHRIELGEIEAALSSHGSVARAVVTAHSGPGGEERLVAYVVPQGGVAIEAGALREHTRVTLPDYMVPSAFVALAALPLTPNGKVDRRALPAPDDSSEAPSTAFAEPRTPTERLLADVWRELLHVPRIGLRDNFLDLGGHSLLVMRAIARMEQRTGRRLNPRAFLFQSLGQLAHEYDAAEERPPEPPPPPAGGGGVVRRIFSALRR